MAARQSIPPCGGVGQAQACRFSAKLRLKTRKEKSSRRSKFCDSGQPASESVPPVNSSCRICRTSSFVAGNRMSDRGRNSRRNTREIEGARTYRFREPAPRGPDKKSQSSFSPSPHIIRPTLYAHQYTQIIQLHTIVDEPQAFEPLRSESAARSQLSSTHLGPLSSRLDSYEGEGDSRSRTSLPHGTQSLSSFETSSNHKINSLSEFQSISLGST